MARKQVVSFALRADTIDRLKAAADRDGRSRSDFADRALRRALSRGIPMNDESKRLGTVPDSSLDRHGSTPRPTLPARSLEERKSGTELDSTLRSIPPVKK